MKLYSRHTHPEKLYFIIDHDEKAGFYLYVYDNDQSFKEDLTDPLCRSHQQDHLQDDLETAQEQALEDFGVPLDSWVEVEDESQNS